MLRRGGDAGSRAKCRFDFHVSLRPPIWPERTAGFKVYVVAAVTPVGMVNELFYAQLAVIIE